MPQRDVGSYQIGLQTKGSQVDDPLKEVNRVLDDFLAQGPTAAEVQAAKDNLVNGFALRLDSNRKMLEQVDYLAKERKRDKIRDQHAQNVQSVVEKARRHNSSRKATMIL